MQFFKERLDSLSFDFVSKRYLFGAISSMMVLTSFVVFFAVGPNWGIDFTGGTEIHLKFTDDIEITEIRTALSKLGLGNDAVQSAGTSDVYEFKIRIQDPEFGMEDLVEEVRGRLESGMPDGWLQDLKVSAEVGARFTATYAGDRTTPQQVTAALGDMEGIAVQTGREDNEIVITVPGLPQKIEAKIADVLSDKEFEVLSIDAVGPKVGGELRRQGFTSIAATLGLVLLYVAFRFDFAFAPGAILALVHDVSVTVGIFVLIGLEFNLPMIGALLTIVGYSLNDTIVIYDRIRENRERYSRQDLPELLNTSINETLTRTVATSFTTLLAISMFLVLGGPVIFNFALAMFLGIIFGTYSTMFVASPMILVMEDLQPFFRKFMAAPAGPAEETREMPSGPMTASEQRRRERADAQRAHDENDS